MTTTEYQHQLTHAWYRLRQTAWRKAAHALPPRLKYLVAIDLVAGVAANDPSDVRAMEAIRRYERRHRIEA